MASPLEEECIFATIGLPRILAAKPTLHKYQLEEAAKLPKAIRLRVLKFMATDAIKPAVDMPDFDYQETLAEVSAGVTQAQGAAIERAIPDRNLADAVDARAGQILQWAGTLLPRETTGPEVGAKPRDPDRSSQADFRRVWNVARDPMTVLADLEDGSLSEDQVAAVATLYPEIYAEMRAAVTDGLATMSARRGKKWEPSVRKAALLGVLLQRDPTDVELAQTVQQIYAQQANQKAPPPKPNATSDDEKQEATPGQRAASG